MLFDKIKIFIGIGVFVLGLIVGGCTVRYFWQQEQLKQEREYKASLEKALKDAEKQKQESARTESKLLGELSDLRSRYNSTLSNIEQLRHKLSNLPTTGGDSCKPCQKRLAKCQELLGEGVGLATGGSELCERIAIKKDSVVERLSKTHRSEN